jgi:hypothetical protein
MEKNAGEMEWQFKNEGFWLKVPVLLPLLPGCIEVTVLLRRKNSEYSCLKDMLVIEWEANDLEMVLNLVNCLVH